MWEPLWELIVHLKEKETRADIRTICLCLSDRTNFILILRYLITFIEGAEDQHLAFQGKPVDVLSWIRIHSE